MKILKVKNFEENTKNKNGYFCLDIKDLNKEENKFHAIVSGIKLDRYDEVVIPEGMDGKYFDPDSSVGNPVLVDSHNYSGHAVGKINKLFYNPELRTIEIDFEFAETDTGKELKYLYENGFQRMFSVGFIPKTYLRIESDTPEKFMIELSNGNQVEMDLSIYERSPWIVFPEWELIEISTCVVGAYREALVSAVKLEAEEIASKTISNKDMASEFVENSIKDLNNLLKSMDNLEFKGAVAKHTTSVDTDSSWDGDSARDTLAKWASSDESADKDTINWSKYAKGFTWFNIKESNNFTSYKLPHHVIKDGELIAVWRGITSAMAALLGARGGTDVGDDFDACYEHLASHYRDIGKEPPEKGKEYSQEELKSMVEEELEVEDELEIELELDDLSKSLLDGTIEIFNDAFIKFQKEVLEELTTMKVKLNVIMSSINEYFEKEYNPKDKNTDLNKQFEDMKKMLSNLLE